jgi:hypothetical protein
LTVRNEMLRESHRGGHGISYLIEIMQKALGGHPEGFLGGLTLPSIDQVKSSKS